MIIDEEYRDYLIYALQFYKGFVKKFIDEDFYETLLSRTFKLLNEKLTSSLIIDIEREEFLLSLLILDNVNLYLLNKKDNSYSERMLFRASTYYIKDYMVKPLNECIKEWDKISEDYDKNSY